MKKLLLLAALIVLPLSGVSAQNYALIDLEYIMGKIPQYEQANKKIEALAQEGQKAVEAEMEKVQKLYEAYQGAGNMTEAVRKQKEEEIVTKEKAVQTLRQDYFGEEGKVAKLQDELVTPIQDSIYEAVKSIAQQNGYMMILDRASASQIIYASPKIDISDSVLSALGY